eukprot:TRINITY_DN17474_c0_g1_i5.p7 TRINITY_DN17474_c0_g1~~TRINITY_DN17474_c0_g1_i5.p7  ORF type:complete len:116 (+),score=7.82 TRINITY_DN17474_c0_g1_i5:1479-1826(+)
MFVTLAVHINSIFCYYYSKSIINFRLCVFECFVEFLFCNFTAYLFDKKINCFQEIVLGGIFENAESGSNVSEKLKSQLIQIRFLEIFLAGYLKSGFNLSKNQDHNQRRFFSGNLD